MKPNTITIESNSLKLKKNLSICSATISSSASHPALVARARNLTRYTLRTGAALAVLLCLPIPDSAAFERITWLQTAAFPYTASRLTGTATDDYGYAAGGDNHGFCGEAGTGGSGFYRFDPQNRAWESLNQPPLCTTSADNLCAAAGKVYKAGGLDPTLATATSLFMIYDEASGRWEYGPELPEPLWLHASVACVVGEEPLVLCFGGRHAEAAVSDTVYAYTASAGTWEIRSSLPCGPREAFSAVLGYDSQGVVKIYLVGGLDLTGSPTATALEYDPVMDSYRELNPAPWPIYFHTCEQTLDPDNPLASLVFVIGGENAAGILNQVAVYQVATGDWSVSSLYNFSNRRRSHGSFALANDLYIFAGWNGDYLNNMEIGETFIATPTPLPVPVLASSGLAVLIGFFSLFLLAKAIT